MPFSMSSSGHERYANKKCHISMTNTFISFIQGKATEPMLRTYYLRREKALLWVLLVTLFGLRLAPAAGQQAKGTNSIDEMQQEVARQQEVVGKLQAETNALVVKLNELDAEKRRKLETLRIEAEAEFVRLSLVTRHLTNLSKADLPKTIVLAAPDAQLTELLQQQANAEQKLADYLDRIGPEDPEVKRITRVLAQIKRQIDERVDTIMRGLDSRLGTAKAQKEASAKAAEEAQSTDIRYALLLRTLRAQEEILQRLRLRLADERINQAIKQ